MTSRDCYLSDCFCEEPFSGRGGNAMMHRSNPFLFAIQVTLGLVLASTGLSSGNSSTEWLRLPVITVHDCPYLREPKGGNGYFPMNSAALLEDKIITSRDCYLSECFCEEPFSVCGSNAMMHR
ncbi:hypothetical protein V5799_015393 [Amblyomma americanum]|uniref:Uncharacterized protein n=1 Tax=Amblyomma americanum TaxID=6943 RepID=A0AAQ4F9F9_AMBAM